MVLALVPLLVAVGGYGMEDVGWNTLRPADTLGKAAGLAVFGMAGVFATLFLFYLLITVLERLVEKSRKRCGMFLLTESRIPVCNGEEGGAVG
ncbi:MAG: hypothetical protein M0C28_48505 [Candidatus Moduliflexus flocculans]|nr:hypothetical protein [Candidatus Moduliflexus flocculans]